MKFTDLKGSLTAPKKIYLLEGEEIFFRNKGIELINEKFLLEPDFNLSNFDGNLIKSSFDTFVSALQMCPFLSDYRIVLVSEWYPTMSDFKDKDLSAFFNNPLTSTIVVISNKNKCEALKKQSQVEVVDCSKAEPLLIAKFIQSMAKNYGLIVSRSNCDLISEYCSRDMSKINTETQKLIGFCEGKGEIDQQTIELMVTKDSDYKIYEVVNCIALKNFDKAYEMVAEFNDIGNQQVLFISLYYHFRKLLYISLSNSSDEKTALEIGVKSDYAYKKLKEQVRYFSPKRLMKITESLIDYDGRFKSGEVSLYQALQNSIFRIMTEN